MALMTLRSENPKFSFAIKKNPETQKQSGEPFQRSLRAGMVYGWFADDTEFKILFKDGKEGGSFSEEAKSRHGYLDQGGLSAPSVYCSMIAEMLGSAMKGTADGVPGYFESVTLHSIRVSTPATMRMLAERFKAEAHVSFKELRPKIWNVEISTLKGLSWLLNLTDIMCAMQAASDRDCPLAPETGAVEKRLKGMALLEAPYFVKKRFALAVLRDREVFGKHAKNLSTDGMVIKFGDSRFQRLEAARRAFGPGGDHLIDIGCGEGWQLGKFAERFSKVTGVEADPVEAELAKKTIERKNLSNAEVIEGDAREITSALISENTDILAGEFLEHLSKNDAKKLLKDIAKKNFKRFFASVPNSSFNKYLGEGMRHEDHQWEPTFEEWQEFIVKAFGDGHDFHFSKIGDEIDGEAISSGVLVTKKVVEK